MILTRFAAAVILAALLAPLSATSGVQSSSDGPNREWKRVRSPDLEVIGNAPEKDLRRALQKVSEFRATLQSLAPALTFSAAEPTVLIVFKDYSSFQKFAPRDGRGRKQNGVGGYFGSGPDRNLLVLPIFVDPASTYQTVFHEYTHYLVSRNLRDIPLWLNEGIADFYSTFEIDDDGRAIIGRTPQGRLEALGGSIPPMSRLLTGASAQRLFEDPTATLKFYGQSWLFVHYMTLVDRGAHRREIFKFLDLLASTRSAEAAAREAFGMTFADLDRAMSKYAHSFSLPALVLPGQTRLTSTSYPVESLRESEAQLLQGRLLLEVQAYKESEPFLLRGLALDPANIEGRVTLGRLLLEQDKPEQAIKQLNAVARDAPANFGAQFFHGSALEREEQYAEAFQAYEGALRINRESAAGWYGLSMTSLGLGRTADSDKAMAQVQHLESGANWHLSRAVSAFKMGQHQSAMDAAQKYVDLAGPGDDSAPYAAFLAVLSARRLDRRSDADAAMLRVVAALLPKSWPFAVAQHIQGKLTDEQLLDRAKNNGERTEAHAYAGLAAVQAKQYDAARTHFQWVRDKGDRNYTEYGIALAELKRLAR